MAGKGSKQRPTNLNTYRKNWDKVFGKGIKNYGKTKKNKNSIQLHEAGVSGTEHTARPHEGDKGNLS
jgi:hypothetical protein